MANQYTKDITVTVDDGLDTEKAYEIALTVDLSPLTEEERDAYAVKDLVIKFANTNRAKGHAHMAGLGKKVTYLAPKPGVRTIGGDPIAKLENTKLDKAQIARLQAILDANE